MDKKDIKNSIYIWKGFNSQGKKRQGEIEAPSLSKAKLFLIEQGISVKNIRKQFFLWQLLNKQSIRPFHIALFTRQLATLIKSGIPLIQSFNLIIKSLKNKHLQTIVRDIRNQVESGMKFSEATTAYPKYFNAFFTSLLRVGEESGSLGMVLEHIASHEEKIESLKRKVKKALFYPSAVIIVACIVSAILLIKVVPQFQALFNSFNAQIPAYTLFVIHLSNILVEFFPTITTFLFLLIMGFLVAKKHSILFRHFLDKTLLRMPIFGKLIAKTIIARFSNTLATTYGAGMSILEALKIVSSTAGNYLYESRILSAREAVSTGQPLNVALEETQLFSPMVIQMIAIGEETGKLDEMLRKVATIYEEEVDAIIGGLSNLIEPLVIVLISVLVGGLVIAMYLPIFKLGTIV